MGSKDESSALQERKQSQMLRLRHTSISHGPPKIVLFTDKSKFENNCSNRQVCVRQRREERLIPQHMKRTVKHGGGRIHVCRCYFDTGMESELTTA